MKYYEKIDGLRFVAVSLVLLEHFGGLIGKYFSAGHYGVNLFFVISGFLITSILLRPNEKTFKTNYKIFLGRRTLRIFPIYYLTVMLLWLLKVDDVRQYFNWFLTYSLNYAMEMFEGLERYDIVTHFWSLCVEEQFYLFWPFIVLSLKYKQKQLTILILAMIVLGHSQLIFNFIPFVIADRELGLITHFSSLGLGALGAVLLTRNLMPDKLFRNNLFECFMFLVLLLTLKFSVKPLMSLCSFYLVMKAAKFDFYIKPINRLLQNRHAIRIGVLSYGIYVFHFPIAYFFTKHIFNPIWFSIDFNTLGKFGKIQWNQWIFKLPLYSALSIWVASLSYKYIESPMLRLKDTLFKYE